MENLDYKNKVFSWLQKQPIGKYEIAKYCKPETKEKFISTIKEAIDMRFLWNKKICFEFNEDYTILKKFLYF